MRILKSDASSAQVTSAALKNGTLVIVPTDTIYGFSGIVPETDALIRKVKGRGETKPFIQLIANPEDIFLYTANFPKKLLGLWPCALTVVVALNSGGTAAFRCPADAWLRNVISGCGRPIYSTSVNRSGEKPLWRIDDIVREFKNETEVIVDGGDSNGGLPSTLVDICGGGLTVLRQGEVIV